MKKTLIIASAILSIVACNNKKETTVESESTVIETKGDTVQIDTDTVSAVTPEATPAPEAPVVTETSEKEVKAVPPKEDVKIEYKPFGSKITADNALTQAQMLQKYKNLKPGDTLNIKFKSKIKDVCQKKGCWMALELPGGKESFVKFKDYAFFVPLNAAESEAVISGKAFVSETSVAQLRHYAKDGGQSEADIAKITEPKVEYKFMADGVLISK